MYIKLTGRNNNQAHEQQAKQAKRCINMEEINREGLYSIDDIAKIVNVSTDTLRYYGDINLIKPAATSKQTGYRYYSGNQVAVILKILELKQYGFSLSEIKEITAFDGQPLINVYKSRYAELLREKTKLQDSINKLSKKIKQEQEAKLMSKKILLVDDASIMRMLLSNYLQEQGYQITGEAETGADGVEKYKNLNPDLVIMDIAMPEMNGIDALIQIKEHNAGAKVVMCSAMAQPALIIDSLLAGALDFVVKPFQTDTLINAVNSAFTEEKAFDTAVLEKLRDKLANDTSCLSQGKANHIIAAALNREVSASAFEDITNRRETSFEAKQENTDTDIKILIALKKLAQGQEELKELMKQALKADK